MYNWKLTIAYLGTNFYGFQKQPKKRTVQGVLEEILEKLFGEKINIIGASRTDAGVHAINQVVNFKSFKNWDLEKLKSALTSLLPQDIQLKKIERVDENFHARYSAKSKIYLYVIYNSESFNPFLKNLVWWIKSPLDKEILIKSSELIVGKHDFRNFCILENNKNTIVTVENCFWEFCDDYLFFFISAPYFLRKMVRFIVGGMIELGLGRKNIDDFTIYLEKNFSQRFSSCAPPYGLYLYKVIY
jgi:tRNA pseudouridine38-40 synthase